MDGKKNLTNKEKYFVLLMDWCPPPPATQRAIVPCDSQQKALAAFSQALSGVATVRLRRGLS